MVPDISRLVSLLFGVGFGNVYFFQEIFLIVPGF